MAISGSKEVEAVTNRVVDLLRELGFGAHESSVIVALNQKASCTVAELSSMTGIHHANLYSVLEGLGARGLVVPTEGRPRVYTFAPLSVFEELFSTKVKQVAKGLERVRQERKQSTTIPSLVYTIRGKTDVHAKMSGMISKAKERVMLVCPNIDMVGSDIIESLKNASDRNVKIRGLFGKSPRGLNFAMERRIKEDTMAIDLVIDGKEALISMPDMSVCGWADNVLISHQLENFLEQTWNLAGRIDDD
jgi:sugar-specific transcriptional regulator TrmB